MVEVKRNPLSVDSPEPAERQCNWGKNAAKTMGWGMAESVFRIAIIGAGPAGLSAAGRAAMRGLSHVLLERADHASDTIYKYQKGKFVMATPDILPLRSDLSFAAGSREQILGAWDKEIGSTKLNIQYNAEVTAVSGSRGDFRIKLANGNEIRAEHVVLSIGLQGNINKVACPGAELPMVQYQLDDPGEYEGERIVVIGAGDSAIENAVALAKQNTVAIVNRRGEFARAKQGNLNAITAAIESNAIQAHFNSAPAKIEPGQLTLKTAEGTAIVACDRIIARLGATAPRKFIESCGVVFPSADPGALPEVSPQYESNVPGLYIIGALAGYPLIKQAMNQGYEVVEFILGNAVKPADEPLLAEKFKVLGTQDVDGVLATIRANVPLFSELNPLLLRELILDSSIHVPRPGQDVFKRNDYSNSFFTIVAGNVKIQIDPDDPSKLVSLGQGEFFGEMGLISGRRRTATVLAGSDCVLVETSRRSMLKLLNSVASVRRVLDRKAAERQIQRNLAPNAPREILEAVADVAEFKSFAPNQTLFEEGDKGDALHIIRTGSVLVQRRIGGRDVVLSYLAAGNYVGEMALLSDLPRSATVRAAVATETISIPADAFRRLVDSAPALKAELEKNFRSRIMANERAENQPDAGNIIQFLIEQGVGEATDILLIDESLCVRCDNCEKACADTHAGVSRLDREAGPTYASIHVPTSCRHCEHPHCMADCPPDAIHRARNGEVYITDACIGCGNCERNCPYGVIRMAAPTPPKSGGLLSWLLFNRGQEPGVEIDDHQEPKPVGKTGAPPEPKRKKAVKCDMCKDQQGGPACVRACPTGAAIRVSPEQFLSLASLTRER